jgi:predicted phosphoadenosine phosphosulfate sulfurtransferase
MLHLTAQMARAQKRKISVLFIDWEAQFSCTIEHVNALREGYRCHRALLLGGASADHAKFLSQYQPEWQCWAPDVRWVRQPPEGAITAADYFDFYQTGMTFEAFVRSFSDWFALHRPAAMLVGIRADESYNRFLTIANNAQTALRRR